MHMPPAKEYRQARRRMGSGAMDGLFARCAHLAAVCGAGVGSQPGALELQLPALPTCVHQFTCRREKWVGALVEEALHTGTTNTAGIIGNKHPPRYIVAPSPSWPLKYPNCMQPTGTCARTQALQREPQIDGGAASSAKATPTGQ